MPIEFEASATDYEAAIRATIKKYEDEELARGRTSKFKIDSAVPTNLRLVVGYGYDLDARNADTIISDLTSQTVGLVDLPEKSGERTSKIC